MKKLLNKVDNKYKIWKFGPLFHRTILARKFLKGSGLEIGGMHEPVKLGKNVKVKYLDLHSKETSIKRFPDLNPKLIVNVDIIDNGFKFDKVDNNSQDFIIANHVLEHSPNPFGTLDVWTNALKNNGRLFIGIPVAEECFDKGRKITTLSHLIEDYELYQQNNIEQIFEKNKEHLREFITVSKKNMTIERGLTYYSPSENEIEAEINATDMVNLDIHFHTFTTDSFEEFLEHYCHSINKDIEVLKVEKFGGEIIGILSKK